MRSEDYTLNYVRALERELTEDSKALKRMFVDLYWGKLPADSLVIDEFLTFCFQRLEDGTYSAYLRVIEDIRATTDRIMDRESIKAREYATFFLIYLLLKHQADRSLPEDFNTMLDITLEKLEDYTDE